MGYRSNVTIAFYTCSKDNARVKALMIREWIRKKLEETSSWPEHEYWRFNPDFGMVFTADSVKWYSDYPDVKVINNMINQFDLDFCDTPENYALEFVRIGEEDNDIETAYLGDPQYFVRVHRSVEVEI